MIDGEAYQRLSDEMQLTIEARRHYAETQADAAIRTNRYRLWHHYMYPIDGDQWPADRSKRPNMVHMTENVINPTIVTEARIESRLPKVKLLPNLPSDPHDRMGAEQSERVHMRWLEDADWETKLAAGCLTKGITNVLVLKPFWETPRNPRHPGDKGQPNFSVIETPGNLRIGWGASDYSTKDWALYEYSISPYEAMKRWPNVQIEKVTGKTEPLKVTLTGADHTDPLAQRSFQSATNDVGPIARPDLRMLTDYEGKQVRVWDYWCKYIDADGSEHIRQAFFLNGTLVDGPTPHDYYPDIPYIIIPHDLEPTNPWGAGDVQALMDIQMQLNLALSHWSQFIVDEIDPAWQVNAAQAQPGMVPSAGQIVATGDPNSHITPIEKPANTQPIEQWISELKEGLHFVTGLSDIAFGKAPGAQTAGRALDIQIQSMANRIDPRRDRLYAGLKTLLRFWTVMAVKINPTFPVTQTVPGANGGPAEEKTVQQGVKDIIDGYGRWKVVGHEVTPRDNVELITAVVNKLNAKLVSLEDAMDELGVDSPLEMMQKIENERTNPKLFPGDTQAYVAVLQLLQQMQAMGAQQAPVPSGAGPAASAPGNVQNAAQAAQPQGLPGQNADSASQPGSAPGSPPPPGAPSAGAGGLTNQTLIRPNAAGGAQTLQQIKL